MKDIKLSPEEIAKIELSDAEESFRRGYSQGFYAARNSPSTTINEIKTWRASPEEKAPPGLNMAGMVMA